LVQGYWVTWNLFPTLRVAPEVGRGFLPEEEVRGEAPVVIVSFSAMARWVPPGYFKTMGIPVGSENLIGPETTGSW
jgi:hypothetical protein